MYPKPVCAGKGAKNISLRKGNLLNKWCWENWISQKFKIPILDCIGKSTQISIKDLNAAHETTRRKQRRKTPKTLAQQLTLQDKLSKAQVIKVKMCKWDINQETSQSKENKQQNEETTDKMEENVFNQGI